MEVIYEKERKMPGILYIVGTPIGNLKDISQRALETLKDVNFIVAEDTRVSLKLLNKYSIKKPIISFHEFSKKEKAKIIVEKIYNENLSAALITDAGMPTISDPGTVLINICHEKKIELKIVPGPSALTAAIALSGIDCQKFIFFGFLPRTKKEKTEEILFLKDMPFPIIIYEAPHRLINTLKIFYKYFGNRKIVLAKELTKIYESVEILKLEDAIKIYEEKDKIKGEYVLIVEGAKKVNFNKNVSFEQAINMAKAIVDSGEKPTIAAKRTASLFNLKKNDIYKKLTEKNMS